MFGTEEKVKHKRILTTMFVIFCTLCTNGYKHKKENEVIYILIWTPGGHEPFNFVDMGQQAFRNCDFRNCYLTADHKYFKNILDFDVVMFNNVALKVGMDLPRKRSVKQKYVMYGLETSVYHMLSEEFNGFFNITFTYKLSSNITIPYVVIKNENDEVIGPKIDMHWMKLSEMNETSDYVKSKLQNKHIAAAWIVSHCDTPFRRLYAFALRDELARYGHILDIFGKCGTKQCPRGDYGVCGNIQCPQFGRMDECLAYLESDYYFYLSFENSFSEDYVTEKLLHPLQHYSVPVVFGRANYTRFMPKGIYLDANILPPAKMAKIMTTIINDTNKYYEFFKWHDHYSFHFSGEDRYRGQMCKLCTFLNKSKNKTSIYYNITQWWNEGSPEWPPEPTGPTTTTLLPEETGFERLITNVLNFFDPFSD